MFFRITNREDPDQTASLEALLLLWKQSDLGLLCLSMLFWQVTSVGNFRTFTIACWNFVENDTSGENDTIKPPLSLSRRKTCLYHLQTLKMQMSLCICTV